jgi:uncharacterized RDD family membrane protein YckC
LVKGKAATILTIILIALAVAVMALVPPGFKDYFLSPQPMQESMQDLFLLCTIIWGLRKGEIGPLGLFMFLVALTGITAALHVKWFGEVRVVRAQLVLGTIVGTLVASVAGGIAWAIEKRLIDHGGPNTKAGGASSHRTPRRKRRGAPQMAQAQQELSHLMPIDVEDIGWWIESVDQRWYGPVRRRTLRRFLQEGIISADTLVRHCAHPESAPVVDQPGMMKGLSLKAKCWHTSADQLAKVWPRKKDDQLALAEDALPCSRHQRPAIAVCVRCHAPYCDQCRARPYRRPFFFCKRCQTGNHSRRFFAMLVDQFLFIYLPLFAFPIVMAAVFGQVALDVVAVYALPLLGGTILFLVRDTVLAGAGPGKRLFGLRVVSTKGGTSSPGFGQGIARWLSQFIAVFNLLDALAPLRDPLQRRYGDRWAKTRVIDTPERLEKARQRVRAQLAKKGVAVVPEPLMTMEEFARLA